MRLFLKRVREINPGNRNISLALDGEPALNKALPEFVRLINDEGMLPRFSSNAKNLTPELVDKLTASGSFLASIDFASKAMYFDNVRGKDGDFRIVLNNLRSMVNIARGNPELKLEIINISHFSGADPDTSLREMRNLFPDNLPHNIIFWSRQFHNFCGHLQTKTYRNYTLCPYPWTAFTVTWNGDVVPCCRDTGAKTILGNVFNQTVREIWYGREYQDLRMNLMRKDIAGIGACRYCDLPWSSGASRWKLRYMLSSLLRR
jgi:radical SAM protein with 4Fe4S-binding SPASM domain